MKSVEQLRKLSQNPYYTLTKEEVKTLREDGGDTSEPSQKKVSSKSNAAVKETGKINKHNTDPTVE